MQSFYYGWKSKGVRRSIIYSHKILGKSMNVFNIERRKINLEHESRGGGWDINSQNSRDFISFCQDTKGVGLLKVRDICWGIRHESFSCHLSYKVHFSPYLNPPKSCSNTQYFSITLLFHIENVLSILITW